MILGQRTNAPGLLEELSAAGSQSPIQPLDRGEGTITFMRALLMRVRPEEIHSSMILCSHLMALVCSSILR